MEFSDLVGQTETAVRESLGGEPVIYAPLVGDSVPIEGMFDENHVMIDQGEGGGVESVTPAVFLDAENIALLSDDPMTDSPTLTIRSLTYKVRKREPDSMGGIRLLLLRLGV